MTTWIKLGVAAACLVVLAALAFAWRNQVLDRARLQATIDAQERRIAELNASQKSREAALKETLKEFDQQKKSVTTLAQILHQLPQVLPLPTPLSPSLQESSATADLQNLPLAAGGGKSMERTDESPAGPVNGQKQKPSAPKPDGPVAIPAEDLKPLYDFAVDCQACQVKLAAAQADLKDEQSKTEALSRERNAALQSARGGSLIHRIARAAKWLAIGAAAGAIAVRAAH